MGYEVRRTGDGLYYLVSVDEEGQSTEVYSEGKLVRFETSVEAKDSIKEMGVLGKAPIKKRRSF